MRMAKPWDVLTWETAAVMERARPFVAALLCGAGSVIFTASTASEAEEYAAGELRKNRSLFGATVTYGSQFVSRILPG